MAKKRADEAAGRGEALLKDWGVPDEIDDLRAAWGRNPDADLAIAQRLGGHADPEAAAWLSDLDRMPARKTLRKEIRRSLFRLEQRGVSVPEAPVESPRPSFSLGQPELEGYLSPSDGDGNLLVWLLKPKPGGLLHLFAVINDPGGMREAELHVITRKALRAARETMMERHEVRLLPTDWRYCDRRMTEGHAWAVARGSTITGDYPRLRSEIVRQHEGTVEHPILSTLDAGEIRSEGTPLRESADLLNEKEFRTWILPETVLRSHLDALREAEDSPLVLNHYQKQDRAEATARKAANDVFGGDMAASYGRRLRDMALVFHATRRPDRARQALAVALALDEGSRGRLEIPFCEALLQRSWRLHAEAGDRNDAEHRTLIVTPQEARTRQERQRP